MLPFLRSDLAQLVAYTPHPSGASRHGGSGVAVPPPLLDRLDTNESPFDLPDALKQKLAWMYQQELEANRYPDGGHAQIKEAIATYVNESAVNESAVNESAALTAAPITHDHISIGNGSDELIRAVLIATCLGGEGAILVAQPTFSMYSILAKTLAIPVVSVGRSPDTFETDLPAAEAAMASSRTPAIRVVFVVHPNSPTGNPLTPAELDWLRSLPDHVLVVIDEAYFEFSQTTVVNELSQHPNWIVLRTFSKAFRLAAHRVGYGIAHPELIATLEKIRLPYNLPSTTQAATAIALAHRHDLLSTIPLLLLERQQLTHQLAALPKLKLWPSAANFVFTQLRDSQASDETLDALFQQLKAQGTLLRKINSGFRITIGTPDENHRTLERFKRLLSR